MLDDPYLSGLAHTLAGARGSLHQDLEDLSADQPLQVERLPVHKHPRAGDRCLYWVKDPAVADGIRRKWRQLATLHHRLEESGVDFRRNRGLWIPACADDEAGDNQVNITKSESWGTKEVSRQALEEELAEAGRRSEISILRQVPEDSFLLCRLTGVALRVGIRGSQREKGLEAFGFNDFAIVLGEIPVNFPPQRPRPKRADAWRGVVDPLFRFSRPGAFGDVWLWVYPESARGGHSL